MDMDQIPEEILKNPVPPIKPLKYDWSLAQPQTKLITTDLDGAITEWYGDVTSELCVVVTCDYMWKRNPQNGYRQNKEIGRFWGRTNVLPFKGNWQASAEMRPVTKKPAYNQIDFLNFFRHMALYSQVARREFDLGVAPNDAYVSPFYTPECVVNDEKVKP